MINISKYRGGPRAGNKLEPSWLLGWAPRCQGWPTALKRLWPPERKHSKEPFLLHYAGRLGQHGEKAEGLLGVG